VRYSYSVSGDTPDISHLPSFIEQIYFQTQAPKSGLGDCWQGHDIPHSTKYGKYFPIVWNPNAT
jgi:hypothetical protein